MDRSYSLASLTIEPGLIAKCLIPCDDTHATIRNATVLASTAKVYHDVVESESFFINLIKLIDSNNSRFLDEIRLANVSHVDSSTKAISFKQRYFELRNFKVIKAEIFPGTLFSSVFAFEDGLEVLSFDDGIMKSFKLECDSTPQLIEIPNGMQAPTMDSGRSSFSACSKNFCVINPCHNSVVYIFNMKTKKYLTQYQTKGDIYQLTIKDNFLYIAEEYRENYCSLLIFNLDLLDQSNPITIKLPRDGQSWISPYQICFGEEYLIYIRRVYGKNQICALPLSCLQNAASEEMALLWIAGDITECYRYLFSRGNHFIEASYDLHLNSWNISRIDITAKDFVRKAIVKNLFPFQYDETVIDIYFHNDRIFFAYEIQSKETKILSYDIKAKSLSKSCFIPKKESHSSFESQFLTTATNIYHLMIHLGPLIPETGKFEIQASLTTLTYAKA